MTIDDKFGIGDANPFEMMSKEEATELLFAIIGAYIIGKIRTLYPNGTAVTKGMILEHAPVFTSGMKDYLEIEASSYPRAIGTAIDLGYANEDFELTEKGQLFFNAATEKEVMYN